MIGAVQQASLASVELGREEISRLPAEHKAEHVALKRVEEPPEQSAGGTFRRIIPWPDDCGAGGGPPARARWGRLRERRAG
ncbi:hypothetical protein [Microbispora rosea]|uniref:hypothetical protein n=1 Tax=Microbispora rosea TaxID=58117 RepID=UPI003427D4FD